MDDTSCSLSTYINGGCQTKILSFCSKTQYIYSFDSLIFWDQRRKFVCFFKGRIEPLPDKSKLYFQSSPGY